MPSLTTCCGLQVVTPDPSGSGGLAINNNFICIGQSGIITGQLSTARGGTGVNASSASNGQILIGNGSGFSLATLTQGSNVTITNGAGTITIAASGGSTSPGGSNTQVQFNDSSSFGGDSGLTYNKTTDTLTTSVLNLSASTNQIVLDSTGNTTTITDSATASRTITLPDATGTVALTANKLSAFAATTSAELAGVISDETGTGALVFADTPTLVTPALGAATATTINGLTITSTTSGTLTLANSSTLATSGANSITLTSTGATNVTLPTSGTLATLTGTETLCNKTLCSPKITASVLDTNGNAVLTFSAAASAVNQLEVTNAATGTSPVLKASGSDTDISVLICPKGAGVVRACKAIGSYVTDVSGTSGAVNIDASTSNHFRICFCANRAICNPTSMTDGFKYTFELIQCCANNTISSFGTKFAFGTDVTCADAMALTATLGARVFLGGIYNNNDDKLFITSLSRGY